MPRDEWRAVMLDFRLGQTWQGVTHVFWLSLACLAVLPWQVQAQEAPDRQEAPGRFVLEAGIVGGKNFAGRYVGINGWVVGPVSLYGMVETYRCADRTGTVQTYYCERLAEAGQALVAAWDDLQAVYREALPEVMAATLDAEERGGWPDMADLLAAAGVDQASYYRAYDVRKATDAEARVTAAVSASDGAAARAALDDWMAVILDALEAAGGPNARERGAAILDAAVTVAKRTTFAHPDAERVRQAEAAAREAYGKALEAALLADLERSDRCADCVAWRQAADALFGAVVPDPQLGEDAVAAARLCFGGSEPRNGPDTGPRNRLGRNDV